MRVHGRARRGAGGRWPVRAASLLAPPLLLAGCAGVLDGHELAPSGLPRPEDELRHQLRSGHAAAAYENVTGEDSPAPADEVLRLLYAGTAAYYAGRYEESGQLLDLAFAMTEDRVTESVSRQALSFLTNDRALPWEPSPTERLMLHFYGALTFYRAGEPYEAAVEARRMSALLDDLAEDGAEHPFFRYLAGALFELVGEMNDAAVAYRLAGALPAASAPGPVPADSADVVVLMERGFVAHRVEQAVMVVLPGRVADMLTDGAAGDKLAAAGLVAARLLAVASYRGHRTWYHDGRYRRPLHLEPWGADCHAAGSRCDEDDDENPYLLRIAWPVYRSTSFEDGPVATDGARTVQRLELDVSGGVVQDFERRRADLIARTVARAAAKLAVTKTVEHKVGERDELAGQILGILTNIGTLVTERADTRTWHLLPAEVTLHRVRLPAGRHELTATVGDRTVELGPIDASGGRLYLLPHRVWR